MRGSIGRTRGIALGVLLVLAGLIQVVVLSPVDWPGAVPDLLVPIVVGVALGAGPVAGALAGLMAGAVLDIAPPAGHPLGQWAFVLGVLGYAVALFVDENAGILRGVLLSAAVGALAPVLFNLLGHLLSDPRAGVIFAIERAPAAAAWSALLAFGVLPGTRLLVRGPGRTRADRFGIPVGVGL
jgi:rod shape-determining protein MreD